MITSTCTSSRIFDTQYVQSMSRINKKTAILNLFLLLHNVIYLSFGQRCLSSVTLEQRRLLSQLECDRQLFLSMTPMWAKSTPNWWSRVFIHKTAIVKCVYMYSTVVTVKLRYRNQTGVKTLDTYVLSMTYILCFFSIICISLKSRFYTWKNWFRTARLFSSSIWIKVYMSQGLSNA